MVGVDDVIVVSIFSGLLFCSELNWKAVILS